MAVARVTSTDAVKAFRVAMVKFMEAANGALGGVDSEIQRMTNWLEVEQPLYWSHQIKKVQQELSLAKSDLHRKRLAAPNGEPARATEQKEMVDKLKRKLMYAEEKLETVRRCARASERSVMEYQGYAHPLKNHLETEVPRAVASLDAMIAALEAYIQLSPGSMPMATPDLASSSSGGGGLGSGSSGAASSSGAAATASSTDAESASDEEHAAEETSSAGEANAAQSEEEQA